MKSLKMFEALLEKNAGDPAFIDAFLQLEKDARQLSVDEIMVEVGEFVKLIDMNMISTHNTHALAAYFTVAGYLLAYGKDKKVVPFTIFEELVKIQKERTVGNATIQ